jgi:hypothetical protein
MTPANILLAVDLLGSLVTKVMQYQASIRQAIAEGRDLTDSELDAMSIAAGQELELARRRIEALKK